MRGAVFFYNVFLSDCDVFLLGDHNNSLRDCFDAWHSISCSCLSFCLFDTHPFALLFVHYMSLLLLHIHLHSCRKFVLGLRSHISLARTEARQMHKCQPPSHLRARSCAVVNAGCSCVLRPLPVSCPFHVQACTSSHGRNGGRESHKSQGAACTGIGNPAGRAGHSGSGRQGKWAVRLVVRPGSVVVSFALFIFPSIAVASLPHSLSCSTKYGKGKNQ